MLKQLQLIKLSGSNYNMGYQCGRECSEKIRKMTNYLIKKLNANAHVGLEEMLSRTEAYIRCVEKYVPHLAEEMKGMADGANISLEEVYFQQAGFIFLSSNVGCTSFAISGDRISDGTLVMGKNKDWEPELEELGTMIHYVPNEGPTIMMYAWAGTYATDGISSKGIGVFSNGLWSVGSPQEGCPMGFVYRYLLEQSSVKEAIEVIRKLKRSQSMNFLLAHAEGDIKDFETTVYDDRIIEAKKGFLAHTNHYIDPDLKKLDLILNDLADSPIRLKVINELISNEDNKIDIEKVKSFLRNHTNFPASVCRHQGNDPSDMFKNMKTTVSMISELGKGVMHASVGNPCINEYYRYEI